MGYTPESEQIDEERIALKDAIEAFCKKAANRIHSKDFTREHKEACMNVRNKLEIVRLDLEAL